MILLVGNEIKYQKIIEYVREKLHANIITE